MASPGKFEIESPLFWLSKVWGHIEGDFEVVKSKHLKGCSVPALVMLFPDTFRIQECLEIEKNFLFSLFLDIFCLQWILLFSLF